MSFWESFKDWMLAVGNPDEWERQRAQRNATQRSTEQRLGQIGLRAYQKARQADAQRGRDVQYEDDDCIIKVKNGYHRRGDQYVTDVLIFDRRSSSGAGWHMVIDESGNVLHEGWKSERD